MCLSTEDYRPSLHRKGWPRWTPREHPQVTTLSPQSPPDRVLDPSTPLTSGPAASLPVWGLCRALLEGEGGPSGQSQSGCRAVTGDVKAVVGGGAVTGGWECGWGWCWGMGMPLGQSQCNGKGGGGLPPPPPHHLQAIPWVCRLSLFWPL